MIESNMAIKQNLIAYAMEILYSYLLILSISYLFFPPRDALPSTVAPTDPRQFCVPYRFGSSVQANVNMPNMMSNRVYSGMNNGSRMWSHCELEAEGYSSYTCSFFS